MEINVELFQKTNESLSQYIRLLLSNTYVLLVKTQNFHWNITGPRFQQLHLLFESQYEDLFKAVDVIAEQIRILGFRPPSSLQEFLNLTSLDENNSRLSENQMLESLLNDHLQIQSEIKEAIDKCKEINDEGTCDLLIDRLRAHEKISWMLRSHLEESEL